MLAPRLDCPWALQGGRMTKADLVEKVTAQIARTAGPLISKKDCARVVDSFLDAVKAALAEQHNIEIRGFGTFKIRQRKTRMALTPHTTPGPLTIASARHPAHRHPAVRANRQLRSVRPVARRPAVPREGRVSGPRTRHAVPVVAGVESGRLRDPELRALRAALRR